MRAVLECFLHFVRLDANSCSGLKLVFGAFVQQRGRYGIRIFNPTLFTGSFFRELSSSSMYYWIIHRGKNFKTKKSRVPYICVSRGMYFMMTYDVQIADC